MNQNNVFIIREFEKLYSGNYPTVKNFARMLLKSEEDAEDIAQDVFTKLWSQPELWLDLSADALNKRLYVITKNSTLNFIKRQKLEQNYQEELFRKNLLEEMFGTADDPLEDIYFREIRLIIKIALDSTPPKRKEIFMMSRFQGMSNLEIAEKRHISVRTVEHQIYRTLAELKKMIFFLFFFYFL